MSVAPHAARRRWEPPVRTRALSAMTLGVLAVIGLVVAFSLSSTLVKRAETPGVLVAFWRARGGTRLARCRVRERPGGRRRGAEVFVHAMSWASIAVAAAAALGALIAWRHLPADADVETLPATGRASARPGATPEITR